MSFENTKKYCGECGVLSLKIYEDPNDKLVGYCKLHFDLLCNKCSGCNKAINPGEETKMLNSRKYHIQCFSNDIKCDKCSRPIINQEYKVALNKNYHTHCFTCTLCSTNLCNASFDEISGCPYCKNCKIEYEKNPSAVISNSGISHKIVLNVNDEKTKESNEMKSNLYNNLQKGKENCTWCRKVISLGDSVEHNGNIYHGDCFTCTQCSTPIGNKPFKSDGNGFAICTQCFDKLKPTTNCTGCKKPITSTYTLVNGQKYHQQCFVCFQCKGSLEKGYIEKDGVPMCGKCGSQQQTRTFVNNKLPGGPRPNGRL